ncbi:hypothetical protein CRG98_018186 [Punica granatum]|uniref:Uncharacterized protein n=1 Tax=Punica granatum TaxID=22663 RepID=A0A2I0JYU2_PUNGR|nr:hypothetical protein CRG98_018186 [Punica granatum]
MEWEQKKSFRFAAQELLRRGDSRLAANCGAIVVIVEGGHDRQAWRCSIFIERERLLGFSRRGRKFRVRKMKLGSDPDHFVFVRPNSTQSNDPDEK